MALLPVRDDTKEFFEKQKEELAEEMNAEPTDLTFDDAVRDSVDDLPDGDELEKLRKLIGGR